MPRGSDGSEDLLDLLRRVILQHKLRREPAGKAFVGTHQLVHVTGVARKNDRELPFVGGDVVHQLVDGLLTVLVGQQGIGFVDKKLTAHGFHDALMHLLGRMTDIAGDQLCCRAHDALGMGQQTKVVVDLAKQIGDGGFAGAGTAAQADVHAEPDVRMKDLRRSKPAGRGGVGPAESLAFKIGLQGAHLVFDPLLPHKGFQPLDGRLVIDLIGKVLPGFQREDGIRVLLAIAVHPGDQIGQAPAVAAAALRQNAPQLPDVTRFHPDLELGVEPGPVQQVGDLKAVWRRQADHAVLCGGPGVHAGQQNAAGKRSPLCDIAGHRFAEKINDHTVMDLVEGGQLQQKLVPAAVGEKIGVGQDQRTVIVLLHHIVQLIPGRVQIHASHAEGAGMQTCCRSGCGGSLR